MSNRDLKRARLIGFASEYFDKPSLDKQKELLSKWEFSEHVYTSWGEIEAEAIIQPGDVIGVYDFYILAKTRTEMFKRIKFIVDAGAGIQILSNQATTKAVLWPEELKTTVQALNRATEFYNERQTLPGRIALENKERPLKFQEMRFQNMFTEYLKKVDRRSELTIRQICKKLGESSATYYTYVERYFMMYLNGDWEYPGEVSDRAKKFLLKRFPNLKKDKEGNYYIKKSNQ